MLSGPALAADLPVSYKTPLLSPRPVVSWSDIIYVGGSIGADWRLVDSQVTAHRLAAGEPLTIVALGSSSTGGAGASSPAAS
jgi:hypothetical protein